MQGIINNNNQRGNNQIRAIMCNVIDRSVKTEVSVYKLAIKTKNGNFVSPAIPSVKYVPGPVPKPKRTRKKAYIGFYNDILTFRYTFKEDFYGMTSGYPYLPDAIAAFKFKDQYLQQLKNDGLDLAIIRITIKMQDGSGVYYGTYGTNTVYMGDYITEVEQIITE